MAGAARLNTACCVFQFGRDGEEVPDDRKGTRERVFEVI